MSVKKFFITVFVIVAASALYLHGVSQYSSRVDFLRVKLDTGEVINKNPYINYAKRIYHNILTPLRMDYSVLADGIRMPLYPLIMAFFYNYAMDDEAFFERGKYVNIGLSLFFLISLFFIIKRYLGAAGAANVMLITAFSVFMFRAVYFQCELLFYYFFFLAFLFMCKTLIRPNVAMGVLTGIFMALAYLSKASALPAIILFFIFILLKSSRLLYLRFGISSKARIYSRRFRANIISALCAALAFFLLTGLYLYENKKKFGQYFYNTATNFYIWCDSWEDVKETGPRAYGDRDGWPEMPPEDIPSPQRYLRTHSFKQISGRLAGGIVELVNKNRGPRQYGYFKYASLYLFLFAVSLAVGYYRRGSLKRLLGNRLLAMFLFAYFIGYFLLYSWDMPVAGGIRLILSLFLPFLYTLAYSIRRFLMGSRMLSVINALIFIIFLIDLPMLIKRAETVFGGF